MTHWNLDDEDLLERFRQLYQPRQSDDLRVAPRARPGTEWDDQIIPIRGRRKQARLTQVPNATREGMAVPPEALHDARLHDMLTYARPHGSDSEAAFIERFIEPYGPLRLEDWAYLIQVDDQAGRSPPVLFSCHLDTVHWGEGGRQEIWFDSAKRSYFKRDGAPLGADDTAGIWLMLQMIDAKVPGSYVFFRAEERGGKGSSALAASMPQLWSRFDMAIAFDRRGTTDIITHQAGGRCCSDAFAQGLADALNDADLDFMYVPSDEGVFTDTANLTDLIPECTNVSCGYDSEHSGFEELDVAHLFKMRDALIRIDWSALPVERNPVESNVYGFGADFEIDLTRMSRDEMVDMVYDDPELFVDLIRAELGLK